jgi:hypothetical protein
MYIFQKTLNRKSVDLISFSKLSNYNIKYIHLLNIQTCFESQRTIVRDVILTSTFSTVAQKFYHIGTETWC